MGDQDKLNFAFKVESNLDLAEEELKKRVQACLYKMGENAVNETVLYMSKPDFTGKDIVDTGRLRASISFATSEVLSGNNASPTIMGYDTDSLTQKPVNKNVVLVGSNVEYASDVELGTTKQAARHYLLNGIQNSTVQSYSDIKEIMANGIK
jgi:phage gpG-like protein